MCTLEQPIQQDELPLEVAVPLAVLNTSGGIDFDPSRGIKHIHGQNDPTTGVNFLLKGILG